MKGREIKFSVSERWILIFPRKDNNNQETVSFVSLELSEEVRVGERDPRAPGRVWCKTLE